LGFFGKQGIPARPAEWGLAATPWGWARRKGRSIQPFIRIEHLHITIHLPVISLQKVSVNTLNSPRFAQPVRPTKKADTHVVNQLIAANRWL
jgi:hypothetical protein